jgi:hypothetical protein
MEGGKWIVGRKFKDTLGYNAKVKQKKQEKIVSQKRLDKYGLITLVKQSRDSRTSLREKDTN